MTSRMLKFERCIGCLLAALVLIFSSHARADEWNRHKSNLSGRQSKMSALESEIQGLIKEKSHAENPDEIRHITLSMEEKHKALSTLINEQREEQLHIRFKHPEKGDASAREYLRYKIKSLGEMESEFGLDARLNRIQEKVRVTYGVKKEEPEQKPSEALRVPASTHVKPKAKDSEESERIRLSK